MTITLLLLGVVFVAGMAVVTADSGAPKPPPFFRTDFVGFCDTYLRRNERGERFVLSAYQRRVIGLALTFDRAGRLLIRLLLWSELKKSGKSTMAACLAIWWAASRTGQGVRCFANDFEQAQGRVFASAVALLRMNGWEKAGLVKITADEIRFTNGSIIRAVAHDERGEAGSGDTLNIFDEMCLMSSERSYRLWEEATPIPTVAEAWNVIVTTAGFTGEVPLLEGLYARGLAGQRLDDDLEVYEADGGMRMFWSHTPRQPWQTPEYYAEQRASLRPATYLRLHENRWVSASGSFITDTMWDDNVTVDGPLLTCDASVCFGLDGGLRHDLMAVVGVAWVDGRLRLVCHRIWRPTPGEPLNLELTVEAYLRECAKRYDIAAVYADPWQMARTIATLKAAGLPIQEYAQSESHVAQMGVALYDLLKGRNLALYPDAELRQQALNAVGVEKTNGVHLVKSKASRKIDGVVALAMACVAALERGPEADAPLRLLFGQSWREEQAQADAAAVRVAASKRQAEQTEQNRPDTEAEQEQFLPRSERQRRHHEPSRIASHAIRWGAWFPSDR